VYGDCGDTAVVTEFIKKIGARWFFLAGVVLLYGIVLIVRPDTAVAGLSAFANLSLKVLPVLGIVYGVMLLTNLFIETEQIVRFLGLKSGLLGWILVIAAGILSAGPIYMWYPLLSDMKEKGMRDALIATFLYNRAVKLPLLPMMIVYLGLEMTLIVTGYMVLFSVANGYFVELLGSKREGEKS
jgi:uncharacterized membrane protein YraQ (UPF0718 family)